MAVIPRSRGPGVMPGRAAVPQSTGVEAGIASARAMEAFGRVGQQVAFDIRGDQMREEKRIADEKRREAERQADIVNSSAAVLQQGLGKQALLERAKLLSARVMTGELNDQQAGEAWASATAEAVAKHADPLAKGYKEEVSARLKVQAEEIAGTVIREAGRVRVREEVKANLMGTLEVMEREAMENRDRALQVATAAVQRLGAAAGFGVDDQFKLVQTFREKTAYTAGERMVLAAGANLQALDSLVARFNSDEFSDLSPDSRQRLEVKAQNRRAQVQHDQEVAQRRAEAAAERRMRSAEHAVRAVQSIVDGGALPDDATLTDAHRAAAGTPWGAALKTLVGESAQRAAFGSLSPDQQQQALLELRGKANASGISPAGMERLRTFETIASRTRENVDKDALAWGVNSRLVPAAAEIRLDSLGALSQSIDARVDQARTVSAKLRRPVSPLFAHEAQRFGEMLQAMPLDQRKGAVRMLASKLPPEQQRALAGQVAPQDSSLALAMHAASLPSGPFDPVDLMLRGADAVKSGRIKKAGDDSSVGADRQRIAKDLGKVAWPTTRARDAAIEAAWLAYDGLRDLKGSGSRDDAMKVATGGGLADWGGNKVPVPPGWTERRFSNAMGKLTAADIERQARGPLSIGGAQVGQDALLRALPSATLIPMGPGQYAIDAGGVVVGADNKPFLLKLGD